jgi:hypothetical protein
MGIFQFTPCLFLSWKTANDQALDIARNERFEWMCFNTGCRHKSFLVTSKNVEIQLKQLLPVASSAAAAVPQQENTL